MPDIIIEQAVYHRRTGSIPQLLARSSDFRDEWLPEAEHLCTGFGERPAEVACPSALFAQPLGKRHVAVVQASDVDGGIGFRLLVIALGAYARWLGDPFFVAERFPADWHTRGQLPSLSWPLEAWPRRTVAEVQRVLRRPEGPALLGGSQVLVDGGHLVFEREAPDLDLVRDLWTLLPQSTRARLWPATFVFGNALHFDVVVVPRSKADGYAGYVTEEQAAQYPEGGYELNLQIAAEADDQGTLDALFARRSRAQMWRLGLVLLFVVTALAFVSQFLQPRTPPQTPRSQTQFGNEEKSHGTAPTEKKSPEKNPRDR